LPQNLSLTIAGSISDQIFTKLTQTQYTGQIDPSNSQNASVDGNYYFDETQGKNIPIPGPSTQEGSWWGNLISFVKGNLLNFIQAGIEAYYASTNSPIGSSFPPTTTDAPLPSGSTVLSYTDPFTGRIKQGYKIAVDASNYTIFDRTTGFAVKRVTNGTIEDGSFEYRLIKKADGSIALDLENPLYLSKGTITYQPTSGGQAVFKIAEKNVQEIRIDATSPDIVLDPGATKDTSNKIINGVVHFIALGLTLTVANGQPSKSSDGKNLSSQDLTKTLLTSFVFGNGFNNEIVPPGTPDSLIPPYVANLENDKVINGLKEYLVTLYEQTNFWGNLVDWTSNFVLPDELKHFLQGVNVGNEVAIGVLKSIDVSTLALPDVVKKWLVQVQGFVKGLDHDLTQDVIIKLTALEAQKGPIQNGIAFCHSGFFEPFIKAMELKQYDINTIINYEGPYWFSHSDTINNPHLTRIINAWGTGSILDGNLKPPQWSLENAAFQGPAGIENINIEIKGAFHNDFSYDEAYWNAHPPQTDAEQRRKLINRVTNRFMRDLYKFAEDDRNDPGRLQLFLSQTPGVSFNSARGVWEVDPDRLVY